MATRKRDGTPLPEVIYPPETMEVTLCIPKDRSYLSSFFGALFQLTYWNYWENNGTDDGKKVAAVWYEHWMSWDREMSDIDCEDGMAKCCVEPIKEQRINPVTGRPEVRYDGGAWQQDPNDPQFAVLVQPPIVGAGFPSTKCDAASNALQHFTDIVNDTSSNIATASSVFQLAVAVSTVLLEVFIIVVSGGAGSPVALTIAGMIWSAAGAVFAAGQAAFDDYWSSDALDVVLCALYCNIGENGQFTEDQYNAFLTDVRFELPSSPARDLVMTAITVGGAAGLSNMASYGGSADSDCEECGCDEPEQRVWFRNGGMAYPAVEIFPDEDGVYTVTCNQFDVNGYYGVVQFSEDMEETDYLMCGNWIIDSDGGSVAAYTWDCVTGEENELSNCWAGRQRYLAAPWTMTFTVYPPCIP